MIPQQVSKEDFANVKFCIINVGNSFTAEMMKIVRFRPCYSSSGHWPLAVQCHIF